MEVRRTGLYGDRTDKFSNETCVIMPNREISEHELKTRQGVFDLRLS